MKLHTEYLPMPTHDGNGVACWCVVTHSTSPPLHITTHPHYPGPLVPDLREVINLIKIGYSR